MVTFSLRSSGKLSQQIRAKLRSYWGHVLWAPFFYNKFKLMQTKNRNQATDSLSLPGTYSFINNYIAMYKDNPNNYFKNSFVVCLLKAFLPRWVVRLVLYILPTSLTYIWISRPCHIKALSLYLENYLDQPFLILCGDSIIEQKMSAYLVRIYNALGGGFIDFNPAVYSTKVEQARKIKKVWDNHWRYSPQSFQYYSWPLILVSKGKVTQDIILFSVFCMGKSSWYFMPTLSKRFQPLLCRMC